MPTRRLAFAAARVLRTIAPTTFVPLRGPRDRDLRPAIPARRSLAAMQRRPFLVMAAVVRAGVRAVPPSRARPGRAVHLAGLQLLPARPMRPSAGCSAAQTCCRSPSTSPTGIGSAGATRWAIRQFDRAAALVCGLLGTGLYTPQTGGRRRARPCRLRPAARPGHDSGRARGTNRMRSRSRRPGMALLPETALTGDVRLTAVGFDRLHRVRDRARRERRRRDRLLQRGPGLRDLGAWDGAAPPHRSRRRRPRAIAVSHRTRRRGQWCRIAATRLEPAACRPSHQRPIPGNRSAAPAPRRGMARSSRQAASMRRMSGIGLQIARPAPGVEHLRHQADVGQRRGVAVAEPAGGRAVGQQALDGGKPFGDPAAYQRRSAASSKPYSASSASCTRWLFRGWMSPTTNAVSARTRARSSGPGAAAAARGQRSSRYSRIARRLDQPLAVDLERRHEALRIDGEVAGLSTPSRAHHHAGDRRMPFSPRAIRTR